MSSTRRREAEHILRLCHNDHLRAYELVERQLSAQSMRALVMLAFTAFVVTAAGLGGRGEMTTHLSRLCMSGALLALLGSTLAAIFGVLRMRRLSQLIDEEPLVTLLRGLETRDRRARGLNATVAFLLAGYGLYVAAMLGT
jgi:hypothetical protein